MSGLAPTAARLRIGFAGTPEFAAVILRALLSHPGEVAVVYTQPDRPAGRGRILHASPVKTVAREHRLEIRQPASLRDEARPGELAAFKLDVLVVAAYGLILPQRVLDVPKQGCINVHASLLPRWRGAAPVERAIMAGDEQTGVSIMQMDAGLDSGPVLAQASCPIRNDTLGPDLELTLANLGARCLIECLENLKNLSRLAQDDAGSTYATKLAAADARIDWHQSSQSIHRQIRALCGRLPATTRVGDLTIKLLDADWQPETSIETPATVLAAGPGGIQVACGEGSLLVHRLQLNRGKGRPLPAAAALNGYPDVFAPGARLADQA
ncbi:MAG: methionyl-tRNA formyltransferase [Gammaproteobacteria bacterium]|nr:methionyl-tRNA formyltransferase [Gammaproteobacteria bacterium]